MRGRLAAAAIYGTGMGIVFGVYLGASNGVVAVVFGIAVMLLGATQLRRKGA